MSSWASYSEALPACQSGDSRSFARRQSEDGTNLFAPSERTRGGQYPTTLLRYKLYASSACCGVFDLLLTGW